MNVIALQAPLDPAEATQSDRYLKTRTRSERLIKNLSAEDAVVQSMPDASPAKWHLAHTTWFFETFLLEPNLAGHKALNKGYSYLLNSYYEAAGPRQPRPFRGLLTRPSLDDVLPYRGHVDRHMQFLFEYELTPALTAHRELP